MGQAISAILNDLNNPNQLNEDERRRQQSATLNTLNRLNDDERQRGYHPVYSTLNHPAEGVGRIKHTVIRSEEPERPIKPSATLNTLNCFNDDERQRGYYALYSTLNRPAEGGGRIKHTTIRTTDEPVRRIKQSATLNTLNRLNDDERERDYYPLYSTLNRPAEGGGRIKHTTIRSDGPERPIKQSATLNTLNRLNDVERQRDYSPVYSTLNRPANRGGRIKVKHTTILSTDEPVRRIKHYSSSHKILLVGEGDFSFSACVAKAFGSAPNMTATSLNSVAFLSKNYKKAMSNICELERMRCKVMHGVDVHQMATHYALLGKRFDRIVFNFPHAGFNCGQSRSRQIKRHRKLILGFFDNAKILLADGGEIHITHKSAGFFLEWNLPLLGFQRGLNLVEEEEFRLGDFPGYSNKYGFGGDRAFNCKPSKTYKFALPEPARTRLC